MDRPNVVWLLVDSIRTYSTDLDVRGRLPVMDRFARQSVEFTTCVTTAPSTIMSVTAMMTGLPAYVLARNYDDFRFDNRRYHSLASILKRSGYASYAFLRGQETREKFATLLDPVAREHWPPDLSHGAKWTNRDLLRVLDRVLDAGIPRPAFLFFHFNPQTATETDPEASDRVEEAWSSLVDAGFTPDNTIYVMCSDHGFPDPSTEMTTEWEARNNLSHDLVLTDDNILIPLFVSFPGCVPAKIDAAVSSLDIFPTLLELAGIPDVDAVEKGIEGRSLVPLIEDPGHVPERTYFRCDSRLMLQRGRATAIRGADHKYIRFHDEYRAGATGGQFSPAEVLIDLAADPEERRNLLTSGPLSPATQETLARFQAEFEQTEERAVEFQTRYLIARQKEALASLRSGTDSGSGAKVLLVFEPDTAGYLEIGARAVARAIPGVEIEIVASRAALPSDAVPGVCRVYPYAPEAPDGMAAGLLNGGPAPTGPYDLALTFVQNRSSPIVHELLRVSASARARRSLVVDCNFNVYRPERFWYFRVRSLLQRLGHVREEPTLLFAEMRAGIRYVQRYVLRRMGRWERWATASAAVQESEGDE